MHKVFDLDKIWAYVFASCVGFISPIGVLFLWLLIFIIVDLITGVCASWNEGKIITSHGLQRTVLKFINYATAIFLLHGIDVYMVVFAELYLARIGCTIICGIELYSIFENMYRVTGNEVFKILTQFTKKKIKQETGVDVNVSVHKKPVHKKGKAYETKHK